MHNINVLNYSKIKYLNFAYIRVPFLEDIYQRYNLYNNDLMVRHLSYMIHQDLFYYRKICSNQLKKGKQIFFRDLLYNFIAVCSLFQSVSTFHPQFRSYQFFGHKTIYISMKKIIFHSFDLLATVRC